jgi:hypothetical protein
MGKPYMVYAHGKYIEVEDRDDPTPAKPPRNLLKSFAQVPIAWAADVAKAANMPEVLICTLLTYLLWKTKGPTFTLSNDYLKQFGISRKAKYRVLRQLEKAGIIRVEQQGKRATVVTLLTRTEDVPKRAM